jgi:hypothetical protein
MTQRKVGYVHYMLLRNEANGALNLYLKGRVSADPYSLPENRSQVRNQVIRLRKDARREGAAQQLPIHPPDRGPDLNRDRPGQSNQRQGGSELTSGILVS